MGSLRASDVVLMSAFAEQYHSIGWLQLFLRRISKKWELAYTHYRDIPLSETYLNTWSTSFIHHVWTYTHSLWAHMNTILHGASAEENAAKILRDLQSEVNMKVRDNPHQLLPWHYGLIQDRALDELLKLPYDDIQCWLQPVQEAQKFLQYQEVQHRVAAAQHFSISSSTYSPFSDSSDYSTFLTETTVPSIPRPLFKVAPLYPYDTPTSSQSAHKFLTQSLSHLPVQKLSPGIFPPKSHGSHNYTIMIKRLYFHFPPTG
jgi:hypothetical protein